MEGRIEEREQRGDRDGDQGKPRDAERHGKETDETKKCSLPSRLTVVREAEGHRSSRCKQIWMPRHAGPVAVRTEMGEILSALGSFPKEVGLELGLEGWWEFGRCGWELRRAARGWAGLKKGQRWECSLCPQSRKGLVGAESGRGG